MENISKFHLIVMILGSLLNATKSTAHDSEPFMVRVHVNADPFDRVAAQADARFALTREAELRCSWRGEHAQALRITEVEFRQLPDRFEPIWESAAAKFTCISQ